MSQRDIHSLIIHCHQMAEQLLIRQTGEFYPFGARCILDGNISRPKTNNGIN